MELDPFVIDMFGPPPEGMDLSEIFMPGADALVISLGCIAALSVLLRFTARHVQNAGLEADDYLIVFALVCAITTCVMVVQGNAFGTGKHVWAVTTIDLVESSKWLVLLGIFCGISIGATKSSILLLYRRIFGLNNRVFNTAVYVGGGLTIACTLVTVLMLLLSCQPTSYFWTRFGPDAPPGSCGSTGSAFFIIGVINLSLDFYLLAVPIPPILRLNMSTRKKVVLCGLILVGVLVCAAGIVRNYYLLMFNPSTQRDYTWGMQPANIWLCVEATLGIVCACLANVSPLYLWVHHRVRSALYRCSSSTDRDGDGGQTAAARRRKSCSGPAGRDLAGPRLPSYIESKLVLRPQKEDEIRLTTLATSGRDRDSFDGGGGGGLGRHHGDGIVVRSEFTQVIHEADQRSDVDLCHRESR